MAKVYLSFCIIFLLCSKNYSQNLLTEDFMYKPLDSLENSGNWTRSGINSPFNITVVAPGLEYKDYVGSGRGNSCRITNDGEGDILQWFFSPDVTSGSVYLSFMFQVDSLPPTVTQGYFICLNPNTGGTYLNTNLYIKRLSSNTFDIGVRKSTLVSYLNATYDVGKTYLGVLKYSFVNGADNDIASVYVFESGLPSTEPGQALASTADGPDFTGQRFVILSNNYAQGGMKGIDVRVDGIRLGTSWETSVMAMLSSVTTEKTNASFYIRNAPNPFTQTTTIEYRIPQRGFVNLQLTDASGKPIAELVNTLMEGGEHTLDYNAAGLPAGMYTCKLLWNGLAVSDQMIRIK